MPHASLIALILIYKYWILLALGIPEGPILSIIAGFLWRLGVLAFFPAYFALMAADIIGDVIWYHIGYHVGPRFIKRFGHLFSITDQNVAILEKLFHKHKDKVLIVSKMTGGFGFGVVTLMTAGLVKIPFRRYFVLNFIGQFFWSGILMAIGYSFGHLFSAINTILWRISVAVGFTILFLLLIGYGRYVRNRFIRSQT